MYPGLGLWALLPRATSSMPHQGTKIPQGAWHDQKKKKRFNEIIGVENKVQSRYAWRV